MDTKSKLRGEVMGGWEVDATGVAGVAAGTGAGDGIGCTSRCAASAASAIVGAAGCGPTGVADDT